MHRLTISISSKIHPYLVSGFNPSEKNKYIIRQIGSFFQGLKVKNASSHHLVLALYIPRILQPQGHQTVKRPTLPASTRTTIATTRATTTTTVATATAHISHTRHTLRPHGLGCSCQMRVKSQSQQRFRQGWISQTAGC